MMPENDKQLAKREPEPKTVGWNLDGMSESQVEEAEAIKARVSDRPSRAKLALRLNEETGKRDLQVGTGDEAGKTLHSMRLFEALGSRSNDFIDDTLLRLSALVKLSGDDERDSKAMTAAVAMVAAINPTNEMETTMALQMVAANESALQAFHRSRTAEYMEHAIAYSNMANKAMRSFALHAEAIAKLRRGGEQVVKHVHVNEGGQAVIAGTVNTGRGA